MLKIHRRIAFGDILQLVPALNELHSRGEKVILSTRRGYQDFISRHPAVVEVLEMDEGEPDSSWIDFDGVLEQDHGGERRHQHRTSIYLEGLGLPVEANDWTFPAPEKDQGYTRERIGETLRPLLAVQWNGSHPIKSLRPFLLRRLVAMLYGEGYDVILFGDKSAGIVSPPEGIWDWTTGLPSYDAMYDLISEADALITMDSGPLWMSHLTGTPTVALLGPTRHEERVSRHPRASSVNMADLVSCEPCFETRNRCKVYQRINCMESLPVRRLFYEVRKALAEVGFVSEELRIIPDLIIHGQDVTRPAEVVMVEWVKDPCPRTISGHGTTWPGHPIQVPKQVALRLRLVEGWKVHDL